MNRHRRVWPSPATPPRNFPRQPSAPGADDERGNDTRAVINFDPLVGPSVAKGNGTRECSPDDPPPRHLGWTPCMFTIRPREDCLGTVLVILKKMDLGSASLNTSQWCKCPFFMMTSTVWSEGKIDEGKTGWKHPTTFRVPANNRERLSPAIDDEAAIERKGAPRRVSQDDH